MLLYPLWSPTINLNVMNQVRLSEGKSTTKVTKSTKRVRESRGLPGIRGFGPERSRVRTELARREDRHR
jgi:hypothetical protein